MPGYASLRTLLTICFVLVGTALTGAAPASAELFADWDVNGNPIGTPLEPSVAGEIEGTSLSLLTKTGATAVKISCTGLTLTEMKIQVFGSVRSGMKITLHGCKTFLNGSGTPAGVCEPSIGLLGGKIHKGLIVSNELRGLLRLHEGQGLLEIEASGAVPPPLMTVYFSEECSIGEKFNITGKLTLKDSAGELAVSKLTHLFVEGPLSSLLFGANSMTIDGSLILKLTGGHSEMKWAGLVN